MQTWLFQGNPDSFDVASYLASRENILWSVRQEYLASEMAPGDEVYIWRAIGSGGDREISGVVASGVITGVPRVTDEEPDALRFWKDGGGGAVLRAPIRLTKVATKRELLKREWMVEDPVLSGLGVLKLRNATNYRVTYEQAERLRRLWANTGRDWSREESVAGLWAYDQTYGEQISKRPGSVVANTAMLIGRAVGGVYNKVMNFRALDPREERAGLSGAGDVDKRVWAEFYDIAGRTLRSDALDDEFRRIWHGAETGDDVPQRPPVLTEFGEAPNDDPTELRAFARAVRRGQPAFRRNLLAAYEGKCCISGWAPETVLEAAHIEEHAKSGLNSVENGLLLRSDIHALFDEGLLRINAELLVVVLDPTLQRTPYWEFEGKELRPPVRGGGPRRDLLAERWRRGSRQD
jgi:hypothetical protein